MRKKKKLFIIMIMRKRKEIVKTIKRMKRIKWTPMLLGLLWAEQTRTM